MLDDLPTFKRELLSGKRLFGLWVGLANPLAAEICGGAGFDWLLVDAEHAPNDLTTILAQLQALGGSDVHPIVRPPRHDAALLKQYLDIGVQTVLAPMVEDARQAELLVRALRYPPAGIRGVASARASGWGRRADYFANANDDVCLIAQIESLEGLDNLESIAGVDGVDAVFVGPSDLAAALGHLGRASHPEVRQAVVGAIARVRNAGKPAGVLAVTADAADEYLTAGASFVGVGVDTLLLAQTTSELAARFVEGR